MSKPDKHIPLSPEELFKLLEDHSGKATDFDGMDDFEKEALEGFTKFSSPEKAVAMVEEVNLAVSKKVVSGPDKSESTTKRKVIWFSAAASIVLLVMISVFFLNQSKQDSASNVAIMDLTPPPTVQPAFVAPDENATAAEPMDEKKEAAKQVADVTVSGKEIVKQDLANRLEIQTANPGSGISKEVAFTENKPVEESEKVSGASGNTFTYKGNTDAKDADILKKSEFETTDKLASVQPVTTTKNQAETTNGYYAPSAGSNNNSSVTSTLEQSNSKSDDKMLAEKAAKETATERAGKKSKEREESKAKQKSPAYTSVDSEMDQEVESAYYKGGDLAIKEYVLAYVQKTGAGITGKYKVKANVLTNGTLKVKFVNHITNEVCKDCENILKKALSEMTGWTPAMWGKTASESSVDFVLSF